MELARYWKTIIDTLQDGVMVVDPLGKILFVNPAAERLTGYRADEIIGRSCRVLDCTGCRIIGQGPAEKWCGLFAKGQVRAKKCRITNKAHRSVNIIKTAVILKDDTGKTIGAVETLTDMSELVRQQNEILSLRKTLLMEEGFHGLIGTSQAMANLVELIENVALTDSPVMITGESGTGKELVARAIHESSPRKEKPFIKVNCAALNENLFESELFGHTKGAFTGADTARRAASRPLTAAPSSWTKSATSPCRPRSSCFGFWKKKRSNGWATTPPFRWTFAWYRPRTGIWKTASKPVSSVKISFFRINVFPLTCPTLRERREDLPMIVQHFIQRNNRKSGKKISGLTPGAFEKMAAYRWPGNIRELRNAIEYAFVLCPGGEIGLNHLPPKIGGAPDTDGFVPPLPAMSLGLEDQKKRAALLTALRRARGSRTEAARLLGVSRVTVWKRMKKFDIDPLRDLG